MSLASFSRNKIMAAATPKQLLDILEGCRKPRFPSQLEVSEFNLFDPRHQQDKHNLFQELVGKGLLMIVRDEKRRTPTGYTCTPRGLAEIELLQKQVKAGKAAADCAPQSRGSF